MPRTALCAGLRWQKNWGLGMIIWGRKTVIRDLGFVADFCPVCARVRQYTVQRIGTAGHIYYITVGDGDLVDYHRTCMACKVTLRADPTRYATLAKRPDTTAVLIKQTFPDFEEVNKEKLALEDAIRANPHALSTQDRHALIMQPFTLLASRVTERFAGLHFDSNTRYMQREVVAVLARALRRLEPSEQEIKACLVKLVQMKELIGSKVKLADLMAELKRRERARAQRGDTGGTPSSARRVDTGSSASTKVTKPPSSEDTFSTPAPASLRTAGLVIQMTAWLSGIAILFVLAGVGLTWNQDGAVPSLGLLLVLVVAIALTVGIGLLGKAVTQRQAWARQAGYAYGALMLLFIPIGTIVGGYVLWQLISHWGEDAQE